MFSFVMMVKICLPSKGKIESSDFPVNITAMQSQTSFVFFSCSLSSGIGEQAGGSRGASVTNVTTELGAIIGSDTASALFN